MLLNPKKKKKISIDIDNDVYDLLTSYTDNLNIANGPFINHLLQCFLNLDRQNKYEIAKSIKNRIAQIKQEEYQYSELEMANSLKQSEMLNSMLMLFTDGKGFQDDIKKDVQMRRIDIKSGYVIFPNDWVVIDLFPAIECDYAGIIEIKNGHKYNAPHFVFFSKKAINTLTEQDIDEINNYACRIYKKFKNLLKMQVDPVYDENHNLLNAEVWKNAPVLGYFTIPDFGSGLTYPYGAMIYRKK